jgi:uncharacterized protein YecE (DUF72 family)
LSADSVRHISIGTAGWSIPREHAHEFPDGGSALERYAHLLGAAEINTTFYRRHRQSTFKRWRESVPATFRFAVKVPRAITHEAELAVPKSLLGELFEDVSGLGEKLGPLLVQLPPVAAFRAGRAAAFFEAVRTFYSGPVACEPRHASWYGDAASTIFVRYDVARVAADPPRPEAAREPGGASSLRYHRLHGSPRRYWSSYDDERLTALAASLRSAPAKTSTWCIFDNTASGAALGNALQLSAHVGASSTRAGNARAIDGRIT